MQSTLFNPIEPIEPLEPLHEELHPGEDAPLPEVIHKPDYKAKDMHLYNQWKNEPSKENLSKLVEHLHPIIFSQVHQQAGSLPQSALAATGRVWAVKAIKSYNPDKGAALSTYVASYIRKIKRENYKYRGPARLSENKQMDFELYRRTKDNLTDELARDPTPDELARQLGWTKGQVIKFSKLHITDINEGSLENATQYETFSDKNLLLQTLMERFTPEEKIIFEFKGNIPAPQLAAKLGVDTNRLNYLQRKMINKIADVSKEINLL